MMRRISVLALFLIVALPAHMFGQSPPGAVMLEPGDKVKIDVWQRPELSGEFDIGLDGRILHPLYQDLSVTGVPADQVAGMVQQFLSRFEANPQVVVQPLLTVGVFGGVNTQGVHGLPPGATIGHAVTAAGGISPTGKIDDVRFRRKNGQETKIDLTEASSWSQPVRSGDQIVVKEKGARNWRDYLAVAHVGITITNLVRVWALR